MSTIRSIAILGFAGLAIAATLVSQVDANGDLDLLLNELSFNEPQVVGNLESAQDDMEFDQTPVLEQDGYSYAVPSQRPTRLDTPAAPAPGDAASQQLTHAPRLASPHQMPPVPNDAPQNDTPQYDGYANAAAPHGVYGPSYPTYRPEVAPHGYGNASCGCDSDGGHHYASPPQKPELYIAHRTPNLPSSSLREYFNSKACHTGLWDGYAQEHAQQCAKYHKHIHGTCDCAQKSLENHRNGGWFCKGEQAASGCQSGCCDSGCDSCRY